MKRKNLLWILLGCALVSAIRLLAPGEGAWAVPGQSPDRQTVPTRTPSATPTELATPAGTPEPSATPTELPTPAGTLAPSVTPGGPPTPEETPVPSVTPGGSPTPAETPAPPTSPGGTPSYTDTSTPPPVSRSPTVTPGEAGQVTPQPTKTEEEGEGGPALTASPSSVETVPPTAAVTPSFSPGATQARVPEVELTLTPPVSSPPGSTLGVGAITDLVVVGTGLVLLVSGLILAWRRRTRPPQA